MKNGCERGVDGNVLVGRVVSGRRLAETTPQAEKDEVDDLIDNLL